MARAALSWGVRDLATRAEASPKTVVRFEAGEELKPETVQRFRDQFEAAGIIFLEADRIAGEGVRLSLNQRRKKPKK
jgi:hypothetical protein